MSFVLLNHVPAIASTVEWTLKSMTFEGGGSAKGFFTWDTSSQTVDSWSIDIVGASNAEFPPFTYSDSLLNHGVDLVSPLGFDIVQFRSEVPGTSQGRILRLGVSNFDSLNTPISKLFLIEDRPRDAGLLPFVPGGFIECKNCFPVRYAQTAGFLSATPTVVPIPATLPMLTLSITALGFWRKKKILH